ncbi:MAG: glycoside hydrolase family 31 protein, partial [Eubacteriales bacterium]
MLKQVGGKLIRKYDKSLMCIEPWGENSLRIRVTQAREIIEDIPNALELPVDSSAHISIEDDCATITNGNITCRVVNTGKLKFYNQKGEVILEEYERSRIPKKGEKVFNSSLEIDPHMFSPIAGTDNYHIITRFESKQDEKIYGMGQYQQPFMNLKGCIIELAQRNSQASVPFYISNKGYGLLWNNPAIGKVAFGMNYTEWDIRSSKQVDYWITAGDTPAEIEEAYADVTGKAPMLPEYAMGFWQCKLRYWNQEEILNIAREYKRRSLPISVIVIDYFHWTKEGDWQFNPEHWPDPQAMVDELKSMGIELVVSIWPTVEEKSINYKEMEELGYLVRSEHGTRLEQLGDASVFDATNPDARRYVWGKIEENYYKYGIKVFWLDESEPELSGYEFEHYRYWAGSDLEVGNIFPREYARMTYDGLKENGEETPLSLARCAWAGTQKYGAIIWSGDIDSSFEALRNQLVAGLNMGIAGIPWWTTDIGGFEGGNIYDKDFQECLVRWFQFGTFCPIMRLHGYRQPLQLLPNCGTVIPMTGAGKVCTGADNEVWSYGEDNYKIFEKYLHLREALKPYIKEVMMEVHKKGTPAMRPMFYEFPEDKNAWE